MLLAAFGPLHLTKFALKASVAQFLRVLQELENYIVINLNL